MPGRELVAHADLRPAIRRIVVRGLFGERLGGLADEIGDRPPTIDDLRAMPLVDPVPYSFVPIGGGYRKCIGFALATLELQVLAVRLAQRVRWTVQRPEARGVGLATFAPEGGVPIIIE